jgi:hypothetical protein
MTDYTERLRECKSWRWMPGMVDACDYRVIDDRYDTEVPLFLVNYGYETVEWVEADYFGTPNLTDPATKGCLIAQIRKKYPEFHIQPVQYGSETVLYTVYRWLGDELGHYDTEGEAILAALEAL